PDRLLDPLADQLPRPTTRDNPMVTGPFELGPLAGTIAQLGAAELYKPDCFQAMLSGSDGERPILLSFASAESPVHQRRVRVAPAAAVLIVGLDETTTELAGYLRAIGLVVTVAENGAVTRRDRRDELTERGFTVWDTREVGELGDRLAAGPALSCILEGYSSDTVLDPEEMPESQARSLESANRAAVLALRERFGCPVLFKDHPDEGQLFDAPARRFLRGALFEEGSGPATDYYFLSAADSALVSALLPVLAPTVASVASLGAQDDSVEVSVDALLPTTIPYGARNRHSPDDVVVKVARGAERQLLAALDRLAPDLTRRLRPNADPALQAQRSRALAIHQRFGPWNAHCTLDVEIRGTGPDGAPLQIAAYQECLRRAGDVRLLEFDALGLDREQVLALDGSQLQNVAFQKLGKIHHFRPTAVVVPLSDWAFKVILLVPQVSAGYASRLEAVLALSGIAGDDAAAIKRLAESALDLPRIDARLADTFGGAGNARSSGAAPGHREQVPNYAPENLPDTGSARPTESLVLLREADVEPTLLTQPADDLAWTDSRQRSAYFSALLERLWSELTRNPRIVQVVDAHQRELRRFLATAPFVDAPAPLGMVGARFELGALAGARWRLGSERVPEADRLVQVDLFRRDDPADEPASITVTIAGGDQTPLVAMPTTVQLVCGFGNIAGDIGVLERRLGYRVVAWNRSPNERARHALENGIPLYELDETLGADGRRIVQTRQREEVRRQGLPLAGPVRELLDHGLVIGQTERGRPVVARVGHILDGLFG
ncbi:MAG TPA: hypothetical protein VIO35_09555, partial [Chloroflexota bacterium]